MGRIRTIKPEFPQSETIGSLSRDARLLFIQLWTVVDDEGRARANPRMLASLLYPYDQDANQLIDGWLDELDQRHCIDRYAVDGKNYLQVTNWKEHQKIDHPGVSRLPAFTESSRILASPRDKLAPDLGPRTKDQGSKDLGSKDLYGVVKNTTPSSNDESFDVSKSEKAKAVQEVFAYYLEKTGRNGNLYTLTKERVGKGKSRLEEALKMAKRSLPAAVQLMKAAIDEMCLSDFHMGRLPGKPDRFVEWEKHLFPSTDKFQWWLSRNIEERNRE